MRNPSSLFNNSNAQNLQNLVALEEHIDDCIDRCTTDVVYVTSIRMAFTDWELSTVLKKYQEEGWSTRIEPGPNFICSLTSKTE